MLSPGYRAGYPSYYRRQRRPNRRRVAAVLVALTVLAGLGLAAWKLVLDSPAEHATATACPTTTPPGPGQGVQAIRYRALTPQQVTVNVYNATTRTGLARGIADQLRQRGFRIGMIDNDPLNATITGTAQVRGGTRGRDRMTLLAAFVDGATQHVDKRADETVDLVLGQRFTRLRTDQQVAAALAALPQPRPTGTC
ncbi:LytR C-terminal domain-containing protein [Carbonactinospora thermoautotrophica]|uniref:LytR C-terminal domain-containing protein n=1 Tax=Carbonactinospora thermoautotrophica TaxID=1469144 RepID=UPI00082E2CFA|nr:LytR C-terminal domain-containing protein [Carbonactinospora thermoautotrophica]